MRNIHWNTTISAVALLLAMGAASAQNTVPAETEQQIAEREAREALARAQNTGVFELGQINVVGGGTGIGGESGATAGQAISQSTFSADDVIKFHTTSLDEALRKMPGVTMRNGSGQRNESLAYVRGFDFKQVPLSIDGVRVFLPYDNALDLNRFLTEDLSQIQVQKGYVSVLNGPGGMGGAINLVTRKPTKEVEGELRTGFEFGNRGDFTGYTGFASLGTLQDKFYLQGSAAIRDSDGWYLPKDFVPVNPAEDGGLRERTDVSDWRVNAKIGFTPNETDEYVLSYTSQSGEKKGLKSVKGGGNTWEWPYWDYESFSFRSYTELGDASYVKANAFYNTFNNQLYMVAPQNLNSFYDEYGYGGNVEFGTELIPMNTLKTAFHYRRDSHGVIEERGLTTPPATWTDEAEMIEDTYSIAIENTFHATSQIDLVAGVSYNYRDLVQAQDLDGPGNMYEHDLTTDDAVDWQAAAIYNFSDTGEVHVSVSDRTRFPTMKDRFSAGMGTMTPNFNLQAERARNYEIGASEEVVEGLKLSAAVFYSKIDNAIVRVWDNAGPTGSTSDDIYRNDNLDSVHKGVEFTFEWQATDTLLLGGNYMYLDREITAPTIEMKAADTPKHSGFVYASWMPIEGLTLTPSAEILGSRLQQSGRTDANPPSISYLEHDGYVLAHFTAQYEINENVSVSGGVKNITDELYYHTDGYPNAGRSFFLSGRVTF